jgi:hypothetical protein
MSWAAYEPMQSTQPMGPPGGMQNMSGGLMHNMPSGGAIGEPQQLPSMAPHMNSARPPVNTSPESKNVKIPVVPEKESTWKDISEYENISDWVYIGVAVLVVEVIVICLVRFFPDVFGKSLNIWYNRFKLSAVLSDVFIILIGFGIARYAYTEFVYPKYDWNPVYFTLTTVLIQLAHDILFYLGVIKTIPSGDNSIIDLFKEYSSGGVKILAGDSLMIIGSSILAMILKSSSPHVVASVGLVAVYIVPYILETKNQFSNIV